MNTDTYDEDDDCLDDDDTCPTCGSLPDSPDENKCWDCRGCGGMYSPGTEECDWCPDEEICSSSYANIARQDFPKV